MAQQYIHIRGARQHNLQNIDLDLPRDRLIVVTGLSGSGKSTLAFDTLYAEGQRRYVESLSTYARQFLERMDKPDVDLINGLSPAIAIEQKTAGHNPRSTVGTVTEIYDYLRLLFARIGTPYCHRCGQAIIAHSLDQMMARIFTLETGTRVILYAPVVVAQTGNHAKLLKRLRKEGFSRLRIDGQPVDIETIGALSARQAHDIDVVVDRLVIKPGINNRMADSLELAMGLSDGRVQIEAPDGPSWLLTETPICTQCDIGYPELTPADFSFNSPQGACQTCDGLGSKTQIDPQLIVPDPTRSLRDGAIAVWANRQGVQFIELIDALTRHYGADIHTPFQKLPKPLQKTLLDGSGRRQIEFYFDDDQGRRRAFKKPFEGVIPNLKRRFRETTSASVRQELQRYMSSRRCPDCQGARLNPISRSIRVGKYAIDQLTALTIPDIRDYLRDLDLTDQQHRIAAPILREIDDRLGFLQQVGIGYLTLDRSAATLSGGESQRIRLATQIGAKLSGVLYVLDEPSIGLHQRDNAKLLAALMHMRDAGNTVLVVEHDEETITHADHVVDMGPGAGVHGGQVIFSGPPAQLRGCAQSLTGQYLSGAKAIAIPQKRRQGNGDMIAIQGAHANNLKNIDVEFPLGCLIGVTGVSGSGKSSLVLETLYPALLRRLSPYAPPTLPACKDVTGLTHINKVIHIDQHPIGRTPRSNPATYTGVFAFIRELFSKTTDARMRGYKPGRFSFNVKGGRCEACRGDGILRIEMHFLPDVYVPCDVCHGRRYNRETLEIQYKGQNIADALTMTVNQALEFFSKISAIRIRLQTLTDVGMGYVQLGQAATTLSGGEAQRIKLARELSRQHTGQTLYILDEPTTGLHIDDTRKLLDVLNRLIDLGNTVIVIEHHMDVIKSADYIIDLGPEGGIGGGEILGCGTPEQIAANAQSHTGRYLGKYLKMS